MRSFHIWQQPLDPTYRGMALTLTDSASNWRFEITTSMYSDSKVPRTQQSLWPNKRGFILPLNNMREPAPASCSLYSIWTILIGVSHGHVSPVLFAHCDTEGVYLSEHKFPGVLESILSLNNARTGYLSFVLLTRSRRCSSMRTTHGLLPFRGHPPPSRGLEIFSPRDGLCARWYVSCCVFLCCYCDFEK